MSSTISARSASTLPFLVLALVGCVKQASSGLTTIGYVSGPFAYRVDYSDRATHSLLPSPWRLDNFEIVGTRYREKTSGFYGIERWMDEDGDGEISHSEKNDESLYDIRLLSDRDNGIIWSKAHPMLATDRNRELSVHVDNYIESLSGEGLYAEGGMFRVRELKRRDFTTFVKEKKDTVVDGHPAISALVEIAEVEKLKADPSYRKQKVKVVFVRFGYAQTIRKLADARGWPIGEDERGPAALRRGILVIGHANGADVFDRSVADFDSFVSRVRFPKSKAPAPSASATPAASSAPPPASSAPPPVAPPAASSAAPAASAPPPTPL